MKTRFHRFDPSAASAHVATRPAGMSDHEHRYQNAMRQLQRDLDSGQLGPFEGEDIDDAGARYEWERVQIEQMYGPFLPDAPIKEIFTYSDDAVRQARERRNADEQ